MKTINSSVQGILIIFILVILAFGCSKHSSETEDYHAEFGDSIVFKTGFPITPEYSGTFINRRDSQEYVFFADVVTNRKILFFTAGGLLRDSIELDTAISGLGGIAGITVLDMDTVLLAFQGGMDLGMINHRGTLIRVMHLRNELQASDGAQFEMWSSLCASFVIRGNAYLHLSLVANSWNSPCPTSSNPFDEVFNYYWRSAREPCMVRISILDRGTKTIFGVDSLHYKISQTNPLMSESGSYECLNNLLFVYSIYSPRITIFDPNTLHEIAKFDIRSKNSETFVNPVKMVNESVPNLQDSINVRYRRGGYIARVQFDRPKREYLAVLVHALSDTAVGPERGGRRTYSVLEYDDTFHFLREQSLPQGMFQPYFILSLGSGTYMRQDLGQAKDMRGIHSFKHLNLDVHH